MNVCPTDDAFGPAVGDCRGGFDFTLLFEQSILSIAPSALFLLVAPVKIFRLLRVNVKTLPNRIFTLKTVSPPGCSGVPLLTRCAQACVPRPRRP